jgi:hypothetical protein
MSTKDARRNNRMPYTGPIRISWEAENDEPRYTEGKCLDISEAGIRIEVRAPIAVRTRVSLHAPRIKLSGSGSVKHVVRNSTRYIIGVELGQTLREQALAAIREPWALRKPSAVVS